MSKSGEKPDNTASDHDIEEQSKAAAPTEAASVTRRHRHIKPENIIVSHQASGTDHRQPSPLYSNARILEESNKNLQGQHDAHSVADGSWLPKDASLDPDYLEQQATWQWQGQKKTTPWSPDSANANLEIRTQDLPRRPRSTSPTLTRYTNYIRLGGLNTPEPQTKPQDPLPASNTSPHAPYHSSSSALYVDHTEALVQGPPPIKAVDSDEIPHQAYELEHRPVPLRRSHPQPRKEWDGVLRMIRPTGLEDVGLSSQLDEDARSTKAEELGLTGPQPSVHNEPQHSFVLLEPQIEGSSSLGTSSKSFMCPVCNQQFRTRTDTR